MVVVGHLGCFCLVLVLEEYAQNYDEFHALLTSRLSYAPMACLAELAETQLLIFRLINGSIEGTIFGACVYWLANDDYCGGLVSGAENGLHRDLLLVRKNLQ